MWVAFAFVKATHIFQQKYCEFGIVLTRTVNILTTNELVKLTMLWTTRPCWIDTSSHDVFFQYTFCIATLWSIVTKMFLWFRRITSNFAYYATQENVCSVHIYPFSDLKAQLLIIPIVFFFVFFLAYWVIVSSVYRLIFRAVIDNIAN